MTAMSPDDGFEAELESIVGTGAEVSYRIRLKHVPLYGIVQVSR